MNADPRVLGPSTLEAGARTINKQRFTRHRKAFPGSPIPQPPSPENRENGEQEPGATSAHQDRHERERFTRTTLAPLDTLKG